MSNHDAQKTATSENLELGDVTPGGKAQANVTPQNVGLENATEDVTLDNGVSQENATPKDVTQENLLVKDIIPVSVTLDCDVTLKNTAHEAVTQKKVKQDVTPETNQKTDEESLADNVVDKSPAVLQRADSEESDPYVSPISSSLNINESLN